jgi:hypothetical protein
MKLEKYQEEDYRFDTGFSIGTINDVAKDCDTHKELSEKLRVLREATSIPCNNCQGEGCPVCNGFGWIKL